MMRRCRQQRQEAEPSRMLASLVYSSNPSCNTMCVTLALHLQVFDEYDEEEAELSQMLAALF
jgi:hypothetical protein